MKLPAWLNAILTTMLLPLVKLLGKNGLVAMGENIRAKNPDLYQTGLTVLYRIAKVHLQPLADKSEAGWDNETLEVLYDAIQKSAADNGIALPDVTIKNIALPAPVTP